MAKGQLTTGFLKINFVQEVGAHVYMCTCVHVCVRAL